MGAAGDAREDGDEVEAEYQDAETREEDLSSTYSAHDEPADYRAAEGNASPAKTDVVGNCTADTGLLEEIHRGISESSSVGDLSEEGKAGDFGTAEIGALEAVPVGGSEHFFFLEAGGVDHEGNGLLVLCVRGCGLRGEALERVLCFIEAVLSDEEPGGFRAVQASNKKRDRPDPLHGKGDAVT
jgi:hypothetical protein